MRGNGNLGVVQGVSFINPLPPAKYQRRKINTRERSQRIVVFSNYKHSPLVGLEINLLGLNQPCFHGINWNGMDKKGTITVNRSWKGQALFLEPFVPGIWIHVHVRALSHDVKCTSSCGSQSKSSRNTELGGWEDRSVPQPFLCWQNGCWISKAERTREHNVPWEVAIKRVPAPYSLLRILWIYDVSTVWAPAHSGLMATIRSVCWAPPDSSIMYSGNLRGISKVSHVRIWGRHFRAMM